MRYICVFICFLLWLIFTLLLSLTVIGLVISVSDEWQEMGDGLCVEIEAHVCPVTRFFELPEIIGNDMIDEYTYRTNCI